MNAGPGPGAGGLVIDRAARQVSVGDDRVELTRREYDLLLMLADHPGTVFSRAELLRTVWDSNAEWQSTATITEHVRRLRLKLGPDRSHPFRIESVHGIGYMFETTEPPTEAESSHAELDESHCSIVFDGERIVAASRATLHLLGAAAADDVIGHGTLEFVADRSIPAARDRIELREANGLPRPEAIWLRRIDGREVLADLSTVPITLDGRAVHQIDLWPIPDDERAALRRELIGFVAEVPDAVIVLDTSSRVRTLNAAAEALYGWQEDELTGVTIDEAIPSAVTALERVAMDEVLASDGHWHGDLDQLCRDGTRVRVHMSVSRLGETAGHDAGVVLVSRRVRAQLNEVGTGMPDLSAEIGPAIDEHQFHAHYQPIVNLETRRVIGVEALARWHHPELGVLPPTAFLEAAERTGDIVRLGRELINESCEQVSTWRSAGHEIDLAVNISARQLLDGSVLDDLTAALASSGLSAENLLVEITETNLIQDVSRAEQLLHQIDALGIRVAIDDFGTGWASLTYLRRFPVHAIKIDRTFTAGVHDQASDRAITRSILSLGNELDLLVIAEGIETVEQERSLRDLGCWIGQGYLYDEPRVAAETMLAFAERPS